MVTLESTLAVLGAFGYAGMYAANTSQVADAKLNPTLFLA